jgi:hypothetical protein
MIGVVLAAAVVLAQAASAAPPASSAPGDGTAHGVSGVTVTGKKSRAADPDELICHREAVLGSLLPKQTCARREDILERRRLDQTETRHAHEHGDLEVLNPADKR